MSNRILNYFRCHYLKPGGRQCGRPCASVLPAHPSHSPKAAARCPTWSRAEGNASVL